MRGGDDMATDTVWPLARSIVAAYPNEKSVDVLLGHAMRKCRGQNNPVRVRQAIESELKP